MYLLETVLRNLISNAIRYTPTGKVLVGCRRCRDGLIVAVHDTGIGIDAEHLEAIFTAYYQVPAGGRGRSQGIGLGLSIVDRISRLLMLEREVRSRPERGSMFAVKIRLARRPGRAVRGRVSPGNAGAQPDAQVRPLTIVVIDDDAGVRQGLAATLAKWGHRTVAAESATDAVVQLISADLAPDLVISDYHLADGVKGDAALDEVAREFDRPPASIMMTSDPDPKLHEALRTRGVPLLPKPLNPSRLRAQIASARAMLLFDCPLVSSSRTRFCLRVSSSRWSDLASRSAAITSEGMNEPPARITCRALTKTWREADLGT
jgi:CheY-like chemotaxis protein/anti-sigma regulatory factor (Ser/Thr protein kinase)